MATEPVILFMGINPKDTQRLRLDEEVKRVKAALDRGRQNFTFVVESAVTDEDLRRLMLRYNPSLVHLSGHGLQGKDGGGFKFEDIQGMAHVIRADALADLFKLCQEHVQCVVLNACYSASLAEAIGQHIPYVIGMSESIGDEAALNFSGGFYDALAHGRTFAEAFDFGRNAIDLKSIPETMVPILKKKQGTPPRQIFSTMDKPPSAQSPLSKTHKGDAKNNNVVVSYCDADRTWADRIKNGLVPLERQGLLTVWDESRIIPGTAWKEEMARAILGARVAVVILSPDYLASDFVHDEEMPLLLATAAKHGTLVVSVVVRPCLLAAAGKLSLWKPFNRPERPLSALSKSEQELELVRLAELILNTVAVPSPPTEELVSTSNLTAIALSELAEEDQYQLALSLLERLAELAAQRGPAQVSFSGQLGGTLLATVRVLTLNQQNLIRRLRHTVEMLDILDEKIAWLKQQKEGITGAAIDYGREIRIKQEHRQKEMTTLTEILGFFIESVQASEQQASN